MKFTRRLLTVEIMLAFVIGAASRAEHCDERIKREILQQNNLDPTWYQVEILTSQLKTQNVRDEAITLKPLSQKDPLGLFTVQATVSRHDTLVESGQVHTRIHKFDNVLVAEDNLQRGQLPAADKFTSHRMDVTTLVEQPICTADQFAGQRMKRNLARGQILTTGALEAIPDIEVGRDVSIVCASEGFTVTAAGQTLEKGSAGGYVKVRNKSSGRIVVARVVDAGTVAVTP